MQIWIYLNGIQQGPYTLPQLQMMSLDPATPVWYQGLPNWMPANQAPATASLFGGTPGVQEIFIPETESKGAIPKKPSTYLVWNILLTILCCCPLSLIGIITGSISSSRYSSGDYEGAKWMSHATEWLLILSVVWVVLSLPVAIALNLFN